MLLGVEVRDHKEGRPLEENHLVGVQGLAKSFEVLFEDFNVGKKEGDYLGPGFVEGFVPDGGLETLHIKPAINLPLNITLPLLKSLIPCVFVYQIHFMDQAENFGFRRQLSESGDAVFKLLHVFLVVFRSHIEDVY